MRAPRIALMVAGVVLACASTPGSGGGPRSAEATRVDCLAACEIDLTGDGEPDTALYLESGGRQRLVILVRTPSGLDAYSWRVKERDGPDLKMTCQPGSLLWETEAGPGTKTRKEHRTPGAFVELSQPEGGVAAYYWNGKRFEEVWTAD